VKRYEFLDGAEERREVEDEVFVLIHAIN